MANNIQNNQFQRNEIVVGLTFSNEATMIIIPAKGETI